MLRWHRALRLCQHGTGDHSDRNFETIQPPHRATGDVAETGRTATGLALRRGRHHLRWGSVGAEETGTTDRDRSALRRLLRGLPPPGPDRAPALGSGHATCFWV